MTESSMPEPKASREHGWVDLAAEASGGRALLANDEFFAPKEALLRAAPAIFVADRYTDHGKWMDGWETRRSRAPGNDWCIVRLGLPGVPRAVVVDTAHFRGNHPAAASLDAAEIVDDAAGCRVEDADWRPLAARTELRGDTANRLDVLDLGRITHVRLNIFPDGGVARLRVLGAVLPDWPRVLAIGGPIDLAAIEQGGRVLGCSDAFFSRPVNLLMPGYGVSMADGWETRRRRGPGHDWTIIALGQTARLDRAIIDTRFFRGNHPASAALAACCVDRDDDVPPAADPRWRTVVPEMHLGPDAEHVALIDAAEPVSHVRFDILPDGGVSRLRIFGRPSGS